MSLKATLDTLEDLDASLHEHYKKDEKSGLYILDLQGHEAHPTLRSAKDEAARNRIKARDAESELTGYKALGELPKLQEILDKVPELEAAAKGKIDETKLNEMVETRIKGRMAPLERENAALKTQVDEKDKAIRNYAEADTRRSVTGAVSKAAREAKVVDSALEDIELLSERVFEVTEDGAVVTKDNVGVTPGLTPKAWLEDMQARRPHWWGPSAGGGATGNRTGGNGGVVNNPWTHEHWSLSQQTQIYRADKEKAERFAKAAGTSIGGAKPAPAKK